MDSFSFCFHINDTVYINHITLQTRDVLHDPSFEGRTEYLDSLWLEVLKVYSCTSVRVRVKSVCKWGK